MLAALLQKLFAPRKMAPPRPTRREMKSRIDVAAKAKGLPPPDWDDYTTRRMTFKDMQATLEALNAAPASAKAAAGVAAAKAAPPAPTVAADPEAPQPDAGSLNGEDRALPATEGEAYRFAHAEALRAGASRTQAHQDGLAASDQFAEASNTQNPTKTMSRNFVPPYPVERMIPTDLMARRPAPQAAVPDAGRPKYMVGEREALNPPKAAPLPVSPWGSVAWAREWVAFAEGLTPPARQAAITRIPNYVVDDRVAEQVLAWEERRLAEVARIRS